MNAPERTGSAALPAREATDDVTQRGVGDLVREVTKDLSKLMSQELELAKLELRTEAKKAGKTAGAFGGAGVAGFFVLMFGSLALVFALSSLLDSPAWAALIVTALWAVVGAVLFARARKQAKALNPTPEMTVQTLKEDARWAKTRSS